MAESKRPRTIASEDLEFVSSVVYNGAAEDEQTS